MKINLPTKNANGVVLKKDNKTLNGKNAMQYDSANLSDAENDEKSRHASQEGGRNIDQKNADLGISKQLWRDSVQNISGK